MRVIDRHPGRAYAAPLGDADGRVVRYLRLSVTDRCDLRCGYCMPRDMRFAPATEVLSLDELDRLARVFIGLGVRHIRLTGGEPLVRKGVMSLVASLGRLTREGRLDSLTLTTNGTRLKALAGDLAAAGIRRVNVSLDSLDPEIFARVTGGGRLAGVLEGLSAATDAGLKVKLNVVVMKSETADGLPALIRWAHERGYDVSLIEPMPLGDIGRDRMQDFMPLAEVRERLASDFTLTPLAERTPGPSRYHRVEETGGRLGLISPLSHSFCGDCNRVRVTATGRLYGCLGGEAFTDLAGPLRQGAAEAELADLIRRAVGMKSGGHAFVPEALSRPALSRHMSVTGG